MPEDPGGLDNWLDLGLELHRALQRFQRAADLATAPLGVTLIQFAVLRSTDELCARLDDAVSESDVVAAMGIRKMRVSRAMRALARRGLVDIGPSASGVAYRVIVTPRGRMALRECRDRLAASTDVFRAVAKIASRLAAQ